MTRRVLRSATASLVLAVAACGGDDQGARPGPSTEASAPSSSAPSSTGPGPSDPTATTAVPPSPSPGAGRRLGPNDDGAVVALRVGENADLVIPDPLAPDPTVEGTAVELVEVSNITGSGQREWEVRAVQAGRAVVAGSGSRPFVLTFEVSP